MHTCGDPIETHVFLSRTTERGEAIELLTVISHKNYMKFFSRMEKIEEISQMLLISYLYILNRKILIVAFNVVCENLIRLWIQFYMKFRAHANAIFYYYYYYYYY